MFFSLIKRLIVALITAFLVAILSFAAVYFSPGNSAELLLSRGNPAMGYCVRTLELYAERLGLDQSLSTQLKNWLGGVLRGDFGISFKTGVPVLEEFTVRFRATFSLTLFAMAVMIAVGISLGVISALFHNRFIDKLIRMFAVLNMSVPSFWMALLFLWVFALTLRWLPPFGFQSFANLVLPGIVLGLGRSSSVIRITKSCILEDMNRLHATTARAKGLGESAVLVCHVLKNVALPIITICSMQLIGMLSGSMIIESIFGFPGIGNYLLTAVRMKDMPVIAGFVFLIGLMVIVINLLLEFLYLLIDPRVR